jgi:uncharacterized protein (TIGR00290 family)
VSASPRQAERTILCWSCGKESAWALKRLREAKAFDVVSLMTVFDADGRSVLHGVPIDLARAQAEAADLPLQAIAVPAGCGQEAYARAMAAFVARARGQNVRCVAFGDLHLRAVRSYRESRLEGTGLRAVFPLWKLDTRRLAREMIDGGVEATLVAVDTAKLPSRFLGRAFDRRLLAELPPEVDPCAEQGEFHTFVSRAPGFSGRVAFEIDGSIDRDGVRWARLRRADVR